MVGDLDIANNRVARFACKSGLNRSGGLQWVTGEPEERNALASLLLNRPHDRWERGGRGVLRSLLMGWLAVSAILTNQAAAQWPLHPDSTLELFGLYPKITSDLQGGVWVIADGLHHVNREGFPQWDPGYPRPAYQGRFDGGPQMIVRDGEAGVYVVSDIVSDEWDYEFEPNHHVHIQRFNSEGEVMWGQEGIRIWQERSWQLPHQAVSDDAGGLILSYDLVDYINEDPPQAHYYAQHISPEGELLWEGRGHEFDFHPNSNLGFEDYPCFTDGNGGVYVVGSRNGTTDRFILKLSADGEEDWMARVAPDSGSSLNGGPYVDDGDGGLIYAPYQNSMRVLQSRMMRFNEDGETVWEIRPFTRDTLIAGLMRSGDHLFATASGGLLYCFNLQGEAIWDTPVYYRGENIPGTIGIVAFAEDGLCLTWKETREVDGDSVSTLIAQKISLDGDQLWGDRGVLLAYGHDDLIRATDDSNGGIIIIGSTGGISRCYLVNRIGEMGIPWEYVPPFSNPSLKQHASVSLYPNPSRGSVQIAVDYPSFSREQTALFALYDLDGRVVKRGNLSTLPSGLLSLSEFPTGQYILRVEVAGTSITQKFTIQH